MFKILGRASIGGTAVTECGRALLPKYANTLLPTRTKFTAKVAPDRVDQRASNVSGKVFSAHAEAAAVFETYSDS